MERILARLLINDSNATAMRLLKLSTALLMLAGGPVLSGCDSGSAPERGGPGASFQRPPTKVVAQIAAPRAISDVIEAIGTTTANESITLTAKVTDTVSKVRFEDGQFTEAGAVLIELTNSEETALLAEAEANLDDAQRQFDRLENLYRKRTIPVSQRDEAGARLSAAKARYDSILARLNDRLVRAPFAGLLGFRQVSAGSLIAPGTAIATLDDIATIKLDFSVPELHLATLKPGLSLLAESNAYPDQPFPAAVETIDTRIDPVTRNARVRALIDNADLRLKPGMLMTVALKTRERVALAIPEAALVLRSGRASVYVVTQQEDGPELLASLRPVTTGGRYDGWVEVLSGLQDGESVITEGTLKVRDQAPIQLLDNALSAQPAAS
ncbi:MAG: efflux RND transporter periplasmic adaptor subunit [Pseudomonadales bacterium]